MLEREANITIVIPAFNRARVIGRTLKSLGNQTYRPLDVILVDNNSTDNTLEILQRWAASVQAEDFHVRVLTEKTPGACAARNCGLEHVTTPWVMFFDSDDEMSQDHISTIHQLIKANENADIIGWDVEIVFPNGRRAVKRFADADNIRWQTVFNGAMATQRWIAKTDLVNKAGKWNEKVMLWNDIELGMRMMNYSKNVVYDRSTPRVFVYCDTPRISDTYGAKKLSVMEDSLCSIESQLHPRERIQIDIIRAKEAGFAYHHNHSNKEIKEAAKKTLTQALSKHKGFFRFLVYAVYKFSCYGGRGVRYLVAPFLKNRH